MSLFVQNQLEQKEVSTSLNGRISPEAPSSISLAASEALKNLREEEEPLSFDEACEEIIKGSSLLHSIPSSIDYTTDIAEFINSKGRLLAHVLGDSFISKTSFEGSSLTVTANHMVNALNTLTRMPMLFSAEEISQLENVKFRFTELSQINQKIEKAINQEDLLQLATILAEQIANLETEVPFFLPGGWGGKEHSPGHSMLYKFMKQENGLYTFAVYNSGSGLETFHDVAIVGNKNKYKPVVEYVDIEEDDIFCSLGSCQRGFFLYALLEPLNRKARDARKHAKDYDAGYLYQNVFGRLEKYRRHVPNQELSGYISSQSSGTCAWKVNTAILRLHLPLILYKKIIPMIKANTLLEVWELGSNFLKFSSEEGAQIRELFRKSAAQLNRRLAKAYARFGWETSYKNWLLNWVATTMDMLDQIAECEQQILEERKEIDMGLAVDALDEGELAARQVKMATIQILSPLNAERSWLQASHPDPEC